MSKTKILTADADESGFRWFAFGGLSLLLFLPPFFRGLFFQKEQQWALFFAALFFSLTWVWKLSRREISFLAKPLDWSILALSGIYLVSAFGAANPRLALAEIIKYTLYFIVFWLSSQLALNRRDVKILLNVLYLAGIGVAMAGILTAAGVIHINDGFLDNRIYSTMQYPNALASYLAALSFLGMALWLERDQLRSYLYAVGNYILLFVYLGTGSRGGLIVYLPMLLIYFIGSGRRNFLPVSCHFVITAAAAMAVEGSAMAALTAKAPAAAWLWFCAGAIAAVIGELFISLLAKVKITRKTAAALLAVILLGIAVSFLTSIDTSKLGGLSRSFSMQDRNVQERFLFWKDALKIVKEHPVLGLGGGAFEETYHHYQSNNYSSTQVHNHYIQLWAETGTVGLLIFLGIWVFYKWTVFKLLRHSPDPESRQLVWSMFAAAATLGLHAFLDFDLSLSSIAILLFAMFGLTRAVERYTNQEKKIAEGRDFASVKYFYLGGTAAVSLAVMIFMVILWQGAAAAQKANAAFKAGNYQEAKQQFEEAVGMDTLNVDYRTGLANALLGMGQAEEAAAAINKALDMAPYNLPASGTALGIALKKGEVDPILAASERSVTNYPFYLKYWEALTYRCFVVGYQSWSKGDSEKAKEMLVKAAAVPGRVNEKIAQVPPFFREEWDKKNPPLAVSPIISLYSGASHYILHDWPAAEKELKSAFGTLEDDKMKGEAAMWLAVLYIKEGKDPAVWVKAGQSLNAKFQENVSGIGHLPTL